MPSLRHLRRLTPFMLATSCGFAQAGGFDVPVIAAGMQGSANANSAEASDASVIFYNPAGITRLHGTQVSGSFSLLALRGQVYNLGTTGTPPPENTDNGDDPPGAPAPGGGAGSYWPKLLGSGAAFASTPWNDQITLGLGIFPAGGGNLNNKSSWFGSAFVDSLAVELVNINPVAAIRFDDKHSLGLGASVIAGHLKTRLQVDIPGIAPYLLQPVIDDLGGGSVGSLVSNLLGSSVLPPGVANFLDANGINVGTAFNLLPPALQGQLAGVIGELLLTPDSTASATIEMYGYGLGWNAGYLFSPSDRTRMGLAYRSPSRLHFRGDLDWDLDNVHSLLDDIPGVNGIPGPDGSGNYTPEQLLSRYYRPDARIKSDITLPARASLGLFHALNERLDLMFDYTFIQSSVVREIKLVILNETGADGRTIRQAPGYLMTRWRDSFKASAGLNYHYDDKLTLRTGYQFDLTPIKSPKYRHPGAPDSNRHMVSLGANYQLKKHMSVDAAYSLVMLEDAESRYRDPCRGLYLEDEDGFNQDKPSDCTGNGGTFRGRFHDTYIHSLGLQINRQF